MDNQGAANPEAKGAPVAAEPVTESHPQATPPAHPEPEVQTSAPGASPASTPNPTSHGEGQKGGPSNPSNDTTKLDDLGNEKHDAGALGPRGEDVPFDVLSDAERQAIADKKEASLRAGMSSTDHIDAVGRPKGQFHVTPQGHDEHGMRIPDQVDLSRPIEPNPPQVGPRGTGAPQDTFYGERPAKTP